LELKYVEPASNEMVSETHSAIFGDELDLTTGPAEVGQLFDASVIVVSIPDTYKKKLRP
jgi:hypothetical protein